MTKPVVDTQNKEFQDALNLIQYTRQSVFLTGKAGTGKSTYLSNLIANDIKNGKGIGLLDPHGELVETVLEHIPSHRTNDVILFDTEEAMKKSVVIQHSSKLLPY